MKSIEKLKLSLPGDVLVLNSNAWLWCVDLVGNSKRVTNEELVIKVCDDPDKDNYPDYSVIFVTSLYGLFSCKDIYLSRLLPP